MNEQQFLEAQARFNELTTEIAACRQREVDYITKAREFNNARRAEESKRISAEKELADLQLALNAYGAVIKASLAEAKAAEARRVAAEETRAAAAAAEAQAPVAAEAE